MELTDLQIEHLSTITGTSVEIIEVMSKGANDELEILDMLTGHNGINWNK